MAIISNQQEDQNNQNQNAQASNTDPAPVTPPTTVTGPAQASASSAPASTGGQQAPTSSGRFNNISNYIKANQNYNKDGGGLAGKIATNVTNQGQQIQQNVQQATNTFNTQANQQVQQAQQGQQLVQQAVVDPNAFIQNKDNVSALTAARDASYTGPKTLQDLTGNQNQAYLQDQAKQLQTTTDQAQTETGRFNVLKDMFKAPTYNRGQQTLDNLILQGNKDQLGALKNTQQVSQNVNQALNSGIDSTAALGTQAASQVDATRNQVRNGLNSGVTDLNTALQTLAGNKQASYNATVNDAKTNLANGQLNDYLKSLGVQNQDLYDMDLSKNINNYFTTTPNQANAQNVASADDYAKIAALKQLIGGTATEDTSQLLANYSDPTLAGQFDKDANVKFNSDLFGSDVQKAKNSYDNEFNTAIPIIEGGAPISYQGMIDLIKSHAKVGDNSFYKEYVDKSLAALNDLRRRHGLSAISVTPYDPRTGATEAGINYGTDNRRFADISAATQGKRSPGAGGVG